MCGCEGPLEEPQVHADVLRLRPGAAHGQVDEADVPVIRQDHVGRRQVPVAYAGGVEFRDALTHHPADPLGILRVRVQVVLDHLPADALHGDGALLQVYVVDAGGPDAGVPRLVHDACLVPRAGRSDVGVQLWEPVGLRGPVLDDGVATEVLGLGDHRFGALRAFGTVMGHGPRIPRPV